jgi:hypothetical protein
MRSAATTFKRAEQAINHAAPPAFPTCYPDIFGALGPDVRFGASASLLDARRKSAGGTYLPSGRDLSGSFPVTSGIDQGGGLQGLRQKSQTMALR